VVSEPLLNLNSGYILRSVDKFPRQGSVRPWRVYQNYALDMMTLRLGSVEDGVMRFVRSGPAAAGSDTDTDKPPAPAVAAA
jgi:hypothetical protein